MRGLLVTNSLCVTSAVISEHDDNTPYDVSLFLRATGSGYNDSMLKFFASILITRLHRRLLSLLTRSI